MQYLAWKVLVGLNKKITLSFLIVSHTKFSPNWCFGLFKQACRRRKIGCLDDIAQAVEESAVVNHAQLVGSQDGSVLVPTYDWAQFFDSVNMAWGHFVAWVQGSGATSPFLFREPQAFV